MRSSAFGEHRAAPAAAFEKHGGLLTQDFEIVRHRQIVATGGGDLHDFALAHGHRDIRDDAQEAHIPVVGQQAHGPRQDIVAADDRDAVAEKRVGRGFAAPGGGIVHDIVVHQGGHVDEFDGGPDGGDARRGRCRAAGRGRRARPSQGAGACRRPAEYDVVRALTVRTSEPMDSSRRASTASRSGRM